MVATIVATMRSYEKRNIVRHRFLYIFIVFNINTVQITIQVRSEDVQIIRLRRVVNLLGLGQFTRQDSPESLTRTSISGIPLLVSEARASF